MSMILYILYYETVTMMMMLTMMMMMMMMARIKIMASRVSIRKNLPVGLIFDSDSSVFFYNMYNILFIKLYEPVRRF